MHPANKLFLLSSTCPIEFSLDIGPRNHIQVWQQKHFTLKSDTPVSQKTDEDRMNEQLLGRAEARTGTQDRQAPKTTRQSYRG